ncbi:hypothetical protein [Sporosarcina trichiuri]|uniref:hypothetical protein n=1 Tax=Sporosarcina trichiuri TaxID=3056445 RepID=UPI0025B60664|nr:hypothetical protein [Sporosarcina sp. 0.2-SM1T-5]WJY27849.1 hypothetical protein QWT68_02395 [Sporosarcina sp. 0.2-SM1T-5]
MITNWLTAYIEANTTDEGIPLTEAQAAYARERGLLPAGSEVLAPPLFNPSYVTADKETDEETPAEDGIGSRPITWVKDHPDRYVYAEEPLFQSVGVDGISLEADDVFGTVTALFGLRLQKKHGEWLKQYIDQDLGTAPGTRSMMFSNDDGLWDVNIALDHAEGFSDALTFNDTLQLLYSWLFRMLTALEDQA